MASRRSRIKGIANIPQRRKNPDEPPIELDEGNGMKIKEELNVSQPDCLQLQEIKLEHINNLTTISTNVNTANIETAINKNIAVTKVINNEKLLQLDSGPNLETKLSSVSNEDISKESCIINTGKSNIDKLKPQMRRKFIKPIVNIISKKAKISTENVQEIKLTSIDINQITQTNKTRDQDVTSDHMKTFEKQEIISNYDHLNETNCNAITVNINNETEITFNEINLATISSNGPTQNRVTGKL